MTVLRRDIELILKLNKYLKNETKPDFFSFLHFIGTCGMYYFQRQ